MHGPKAQKQEEDFLSFYALPKVHACNELIGETELCALCGIIATVSLLQRMYRDLVPAMTL